MRSTGSASPIRAPIRPALDDLSLSIDAGSVVALVGHNGSGKTTLAKLLARLYDPIAGTILIDGEPLPTLDLASWHRRLSLVSESPVVYEASLRENVAFGDWRTLLDDRAAVERIVRESGLDAIAATLKDGIDTELGRGFGAADLSRGQRQREAIAPPSRTTRGSSSSTSRPPTSTPRPRRASTPRRASWRAVAPPS